VDEVRRVLLVGFMGAGKSRVGRQAAGLLDWDFVDFDAEIEREEGVSIARIFQERGEEVFREVESRVGTRLLSLDRVVLSSGGGWPVLPGRMEALDTETLSVWLRVSPSTAVRRISGPAARPRPLLAVDDPLAEAERLLTQREPFYRKARVHLNANGNRPGRLARAIARMVAPPRPRS